MDYRGPNILGKDALCDAFPQIRTYSYIYIYIFHLELCVFSSNSMYAAPRQSRWSAYKFAKILTFS